MSTSHVVKQHEVEVEHGHATVKVAAGDGRGEQAERRWSTCSTPSLAHPPRLPINTRSTTTNCSRRRRNAGLSGLQWPDPGRMKPDRTRWKNDDCDMEGLALIDDRPHGDGLSKLLATTNTKPPPHVPTPRINGGASGSTISNEKTTSECRMEDAARFNGLTRSPYQHIIRPGP